MLHLHELTMPGPAALSVRVLGTLTEINPTTLTARAQHGDASCPLDLRPIDGSHLRLGELYQFLGELEVTAAGARLLRVRIARPMHSLHVELYERAIEAKREFEAYATQFVNARTCECSSA